MSASSVADRWKLALVLVAHAAVGGLVFRYGTDLQDEGLLYAWGNRILAGDLPYTDFYLVQLPGTFYVQAALIKVFGLSMLIGRVFKQAEGILFICLAYAVVRRATHDTRAAWVGAFATAVLSPALHLRIPWYSTDACICLLVAAWAGCIWIETRRPKWLVAAGVALGASIFFKQNHGVFGLAALSAGLACDAWRRAAPSMPARAASSARVCAILVAAACFPLGLYLIYYASAGGSLRLLWLNCFVWSAEAKGYLSSIDTLLVPLKTFLLVHKQNWLFPAAGIAWCTGLCLALASRVPKSARAVGAVVAVSTIALGAEVWVRVYIWTFGSAMVLAIAVAAAIYALGTELDGSIGDRATASGCVALLALANLYGGTIPGGGWGRLSETLPATALVFGIAAYLLREETSVRSWWLRNVWVTPRQFGLALMGTSLLVSGGLLVRNQAFRPSIDVALRSMTAKTQARGWAGLRGEPSFVHDTDRLVQRLRLLPAKQRASAYVFPLNCALYPLADLHNVTRFDSQQGDFLAPSLFPELLSELEHNKPEVVVLQPRPNASPDTPPRSWVRPELWRLIDAFVHANYRLESASTFYELWFLKTSTPIPNRGTVSDEPSQ